MFCSNYKFLKEIFDRIYAFVLLKNHMYISWGSVNVLTFVQVGKTYKTLLCCQSQQKHGKVKGNIVSTWNMQCQKKNLAWNKIPVIYMAGESCVSYLGYVPINTGLKAVTLFRLSSLNSSSHVSPAWIWKAKTKIQKHMELTIYKFSAVLCVYSQGQCYKRIFKSLWNASCNSI